MRHVFILNPVAGKSKSALALRGRIDAYFARHPEMEYSIRLTDGVGSATRIAAEECERGGALRLYACGGDGTLQETANGIPVGSADVQLAVIPCGSGNDYVRTYGTAEEFSNLENTINGEAITVDAIDCVRFNSLNIASIGLDAAVGKKMNKYKAWPGVSGSMAYNLAVVDVLCHPIGVEMQIEIDNDEGTICRDGNYLMTLAANGRFYGGGYQGAPTSVVDDGQLDFVLVKKISLLEIPFVLGKYKAGTHEGVDCIETLRGKEMRVKAAKSMVCNIDGECFDTDAVQFKLIPDAYNFVLPVPVAARFKKTEKVVK